MTIEDNGNGMTPRTLVHLLYHIGGSAKRTQGGVDLGITRPDDPTRTPLGRKIIGKIGIGLFSVAQLTQTFQIVTKVSGDDHRTVASIVLRQYSDLLDEVDGEYEAGKVLVWREYAHDVESHGTTILLDSVRPQTVETLRSQSLWDSMAFTSASGSAARAIVKKPGYHIGSVESADTALYNEGGPHHLPWNADDRPLEAFNQFVDSVWNSLRQGEPNPSLEHLFDYYLTMVWNLSLAIPLDYVDLHPFDVTEADGVRTYVLSGQSAGAEEKTGSLREIVGTTEGSGLDFRVLVDDVELRRPIKVRNFPSTTAAFNTPLLFVANRRETFSGVDLEFSGGLLAFTAYILWAPKIVPTEHRGALIRVHNASGTLFPYLTQRS